jgi:hypothetical protein
MFSQMSVLYAMPKYLVNSLTVSHNSSAAMEADVCFLQILMPYFPTGTMERVDFEGQVRHAALCPFCD